MDVCSTVTIEKLVYGGAGLGRIEGRVVLAPFVLPGETTRVEVRRERPGMLEASLVEVLAPSPHRVAPVCPYFGRCGGCAYQHASYEFQLDQKRAILVEALRRVGKIRAPDRIEVIAGPPWEYRNRSQFHLAGGRIGYLEAGSHRLCPVDHCPISSPRINEALQALREMMEEPRFPRFVRSIELFTNETDLQLNVLETGRPPAREFFDWCAERIPGAGAAALDYAAAGATFRVGYRSFFQVNRLLIDRLAEAALEDAEGGSAVDLYGGVGLFSIGLARRFATVAAVESSASAHRDLEFNAAREGVAIEARRTAAAGFLAGLEKAPDFVLADPPRAGLGAQVVKELLRLGPPRLTIVSCDPTTLARDLAALLGRGYRIEKLVLIDLFPQTYHLEAVAQLRR